MAVEKVSINREVFRETLNGTGFKRREIAELAGIKPYELEVAMAPGTEYMKKESFEKLCKALDIKATEQLIKSTEPKTVTPAVLQLHEATLTDGEDTMTLQFTEREFERIVALTKHFKLNRTTDLFHKLLDDAWKAYRTEKMKNELANMTDPELEHMFTKLAMGTRNYTRDDLVRKIVTETFRKGD